ncbi:Glycosylphosphatidylinositol anchor attachment 1 protein [Linum grandiflorum]
MADTVKEVAAATPDWKPKPRPIVRLGIFLISHSLLVSVVCCTAGVLALFLLPMLAKTTYVSENALMPGSASSMLSNHDISEANRLAMDLTALDSAAADAGIGSRRVLAKYLSDLGVEVGYHKFQSHQSQLHPLHFFSSPDSGLLQENGSCSSYGMNVVGIVRAPQGDGKEAIVLVTPYNFRKSDSTEALSVGVAYAVFSLLSRVTWLAKDIIWLVADSQYGEYAPVASWLRDYHMPVFSSSAAQNAVSCSNASSLDVVNEESLGLTGISGGFRRAGTMAAALVIKVTEGKDQFEDTLSVYAEASNGQMPNLDLISIVNYLAVHRQGLRLKVQKFLSLLEWKWLRVLGDTFNVIGHVAGSLNPDWQFAIPTTDYIEGAATLASSLYHQALGIPTGPHGAFRDFQVDAITLEISPKVVYTNKGRRNDFILRGARLIEGVVRSVNNLLEKFHQSFFLYLLTAPAKFVSVGVYMIAFALLVAPLPLVAASLYVDANKLEPSPQETKHNQTGSSSPNKLSVNFRPWKWLNAAKEVLSVHAWGVSVALLPYFICKIPDSTPAASSIIWFSISTVGLLILYLIMGSPKSEWKILKSVTISAAFIGLLLMSVVNFATAEIGALLLVPACLLARPLTLDMRNASVRSFLRIACNVVFCLAAFPPAAFFILKAIVTNEGLNSSEVGEFWEWVESLWAWNSATYIYLGMVHLPCCVLCLRILLHSS